MFEPELEIRYLNTPIHDTYYLNESIIKKASEVMQLKTFKIQCQSSNWNILDKKTLCVQCILCKLKYFTVINNDVNAIKTKINDKDDVI